MMMNRIAICAIAISGLMMAVACKGSQKQRGAEIVSEKEQTVDLAEVPFLKSMGLDVRKVAIGTEFDTKAFASEAGRGKAVPLTGGQARQLLADAAPLVTLTDGDTPMVVGARAFSDVVLLVVWHDVGDGHELIFATYDQGGKLKDVVTTPPWAYVMECGDDGERMVTYDSCRATFGESGFVLHRRLGRNHGANPVWSQNREYTYTVAADGLLTLSQMEALPLKGKQSEAFQDVAPEIEDIYDVDYYPISSKDVFDRLDKLASEHFGGAAGRDPVMSTTMRMAYSRTQQLLQYVADHSASALTRALCECVSKEWIPKHFLYEAIQKMPDAASRERLDALTAQWGPEGAVG